MQFSNSPPHHQLFPTLTNYSPKTPIHRCATQGSDLAAKSPCCRSHSLIHKTSESNRIRGYVALSQSKTTKPTFMTAISNGGNFAATRLISGGATHAVFLYPDVVNVRRVHVQGKRAIIETKNEVSLFARRFTFCIAVERLRSITAQNVPIRVGDCDATLVDGSCS